MDNNRVVIIGAGYTGLAAAYELSQAGFSVTVLEADSDIGGLAGCFSIADTRLEKFYHHWFTSDRHIMGLIDELGCADDVLLRSSSTGNYYANSIFRLSTPLDVLRYTPLSYVGRIRLGLLVIQARLVGDWRKLESITAADWIRQKAGLEVFEKVWWPLLQGKFGHYADRISAVWFWKKLVLRGGSRGKGGGEVLAYFRGGFARLAEKIAQRINQADGEILTATPATSLNVQENRVTHVLSGETMFPADLVINTTALPLAAELLAPHVTQDYISGLQSVDYLGNVCLTLVLKHSLCDTYWLNVTDPGFPYVGIIEHTNFEPSASYAGKHIVYLSKYLPVEDTLYQMTDQQVLEFSLPHLAKMFPDFSRDWVEDWFIHRAEHSQPVVGLNYGTRIPGQQSPLDNLLLCSMAQIYPEDRGTNYAVREGRRIARQVISDRQAQ